MADSAMCLAERHADAVAIRDTTSGRQLNARPAVA